MAKGPQKIEADILNDFQREMHTAFDDDPAEIRMTSIFMKHFQKVTYYSQYTALMASTSHIDGEVITFTVSRLYHILFYAYILQTYPALRVKPEFSDDYQICWSHNLATNTTVQGQLRYDTDEIQTIDHVWHDLVAEYYRKAGFDNWYDECVGNLPFLENWSNFLPEYTTSVIQPFSYARDSTVGIQLFLFESTSSVIHEYHLRNTVVDLLRMRRRKAVDLLGTKYEWEEVEVDPEILEGGITAMSKLKAPEMWGRYAYIMDDELEWHKDCSFRTTVDAEGKTRYKDKIMYIEDVIAFDSHEPKSYGSKVEVQINCPYQAKAMFYMVENLQSEKNRNYSNYTTNSGNAYEGWSPIEATTFNDGKTNRLDALDHIHTGRIEAGKHFPSAPRVKGYHAYSFSYDSTTLHADVGLLMNNNCKLVVTLGNTSPFEKQKRGHRSTLDRLKASDKDLLFLLRVRLLVIKRLAIRKLDAEKFKILLGNEAVATSHA